MIRFFIRRVRARRDLPMHEQIGLALLDVLLGMVIFSLLAVIAFQSMGIFRERAFLTQAVSDARQLATAVAAAALTPNAGPGMSAGWGVPTGQLDEAQLDALGVNLSGDEATGYVYFRADAYVSGYDVCVQNNAAYAWHRASVGAIKDTGYLRDGKTCLSTQTETIDDEGPSAAPDPTTSPDPDPTPLAGAGCYIGGTGFMDDGYEPSPRTEFVGLTASYAQDGGPSTCSDVDAIHSGLVGYLNAQAGETQVYTADWGDHVEIYSWGYPRTAAETHSMVIEYLTTHWPGVTLGTYWPVTPG